jgi:hypothetical protein
MDKAYMPIAPGRDHIRKLKRADMKPPRIRLMQYSIFVLAGPDSDWEMLNSSWKTCSSIHCVFVTNFSLNWAKKSE